VSAGLLRLRPGLVAGIPALTFVNGACPDLGLKTCSCFALFSNLRPRKVCLFGYVNPPPGEQALRLTVDPSP